MYHECDLYYDYSTIERALRTIKTVSIRVKILKPSGTEWGTFEIPYHIDESSKSNSDYIKNLLGYTYNSTPDGKVEKVKLAKENIYEEKTTKGLHIRKVAFPQVQAGSVVELTYQHTSTIFWQIDPFQMQKTIPVEYVKYSVTIPQFFNFNKRSTGFEKIIYNQKVRTLTDYNAIEMTFEGFDYPSLANEGFVYNIDDFLSGVTFELAGISIPGTTYKNFAHSWEDIDKQLRESSSFGKQLDRSSGLLKNELASLHFSNMSTDEKLTAILALVQSKVKSNNTKTLYINNPKKALKEGIGTSGEVNALLIGVLRDAGFNANPAVLSLRSRGRISTTFPTIDNLNYFIVMVEHEGKSYLLDAGLKFAQVNLLSDDCIVADARCIYPQMAKWVNLQKVTNTVQLRNFTSEFNSEGILSGVAVISKSGSDKLYQLNRIDDLDEKQKIDIAEEKYKLQIADYQLTTNEGESKVLTEVFEYTKPEVLADGEYIYINPLIAPYLTEPIFKAETRKLPIEFPYTSTDILMSTITIPKGYEVDELPSSEAIYFDEEKSIGMTYIIATFDGKIQVQQRIHATEILYPTTNYEAMRDFWNRVASKSTAMVVLKKIAQ